VQRHFFHSYEVRFDECNIYGFMTPAAALGYLQDVAERDAKSGNLLDDKGYWIARRTTADFFTPVPVRATLEAETFAAGFSKVTAHRNYELRIITGQEPAGVRPEPALKARTIWVYLDERGRPARLSPIWKEVWLPEGSPPLPEETPWPAFPDRPAFKTKAPVRFSDLDVQAHMNNAAYVELLDNAAWEAFAFLGVLPDSGAGQLLPLHYDIEYLESAKAGDWLEVDSWFQAVAGATAQFERYQRVRREGRLLVRARSRWRWQPSTEQPPPAFFERLWDLEN
jgi:acyl-CoA thioesterase FadM